MGWEAGAKGAEELCDIIDQVGGAMVRGRNVTKGRETRKRHTDWRADLREMDGVEGQAMVKKAEMGAAENQATAKILEGKNGRFSKI